LWSNLIVYFKNPVSFF